MTAGTRRPPTDERSPRTVSAALDAELGFAMGRTHRALRHGWEGEIADLGLSAPQAAMLRAICEEPGAGVRELARRLCTDPMNAKRLVDHLERAGLVASSGDPSHRQRRGLAPTTRGLALAGRLGERSTAWAARLSGLVGTAELDELRALLGRVEAALATETAPARPAPLPTSKGGHR